MNQLLNNNAFLATKVVLHRLAIVLIFCFLSHSLRAQEASNEPISSLNSELGVWSFGLELSQTSLKSGIGQHLLGLRNKANLGWGYLSQSWYSYINFDIISGPYDSVNRDSMLIEYEGTGLSAGIAFSAENKNLRTSEGNYGFLLALRYDDTVGRNISDKNRLKSGELAQNWSIRVNDFSVLPAIFFCWLEPSRTRGNSPEQLMTRLEGYFLTIGISTPLAAKYYLTYENDDGPVKRSELLKGYSIVIALSSLFST